MNTTHDGSTHRRQQLLSAVHMLNLHFLVALRDALRTDPTQASYEYGIDVSTAEIVRQASDEGLRSLSCSFDRALFTLRFRGTELSDILQRPPALRGLFAAVRDSPHNPSSAPR